MNTVFDKGTDFTGGPEGVDRSLLAHCVRIADPTLGWAAEFGTGSGETTRLISDRLPVVSFDSFQGLPEDWRENFPAGAFSHYEMPLDIPNATIVPGWFEDTVPGYEWTDTLSLVHLDADLYSSTVTALTAVEPHLTVGTILVFDEFFNYDGWEDHEHRAFTEFIERTGFKYDSIGFGREQWAVVITGRKTGVPA